MIIYVATTNQGKLEEMKELLSGQGIEIKSLMEQFPEAEDVEETGTTFEENAILKAETYAKKYQVPVLADDSGLEVYALNREPGVYSARYAGEAKDDQANNDKLLKKLQDKKSEDREAAFVCVLAFARPGETTLTTEGRSEGRILTERRGEQGFGYDPIFQPDGYDQSYGELGPDVKNRISHRKKALEKMLNELR
ncbi:MULTISPECIES: XTP/dITP diphosphatase [Allobacillus]|uniref:dITP/XTP pyrophosphatase n=1 Tax=Allobacillus halotolerans TaxID=570278 RepID=A0ABS6GPM0_9BACI|nr:MULTISPECIES: XTP/dITP diphosphatase [Allobacillus]MBU6080600.1 XTP/dITP diphosphatase [Allobacillus halotolerans]TSJ68357.1 XTP/dITP diphosphatase [Allobacillus sp. SKP2-8]